MGATKTLEQRINDFKKRLKNLYPDYKLISDYVNADTYVDLLHTPTKEIWKVKPRYLNGKRQAPGVANSNKPKIRTHKYTHAEYEKMFYSKWSKDEYEIVGTFTKMKDNIEILHKKCNRTFTPIASNMLYNNKKGCRHCYGRTRKSVDDFNKIFQNNDDLKEYSVLSIESKSGHIYGKVRHNCMDCGNHEFYIRLSDMLSAHKQRCPKCKEINRESKAVREIKRFLIKNNIEFEQEKIFESCKNITYLPFDFYIESLNLIIEYDGIHHFTPNGYITPEKVKQTQMRDKIKNTWCKDNNINLLRINYKQDHLKVLKEYLQNNAQYKNL